MPELYGFHYDVDNWRDMPAYDDLSFAVTVDIGVLHFLKEVVPVTDANMFIIYGTENGYDVSNMTTADLTELATLHKQHLDAFVCGKVRSKISQILETWESAHEKLHMLFSLPEPAYKQFSSLARNIQLTADKWSNLNNEAVAGVLQNLRNDFVIASSDYKSSVLDERIPIDPELVKKCFSFLLGAIQRNYGSQMTDSRQYWLINRAIVEVSAAYLGTLVKGLVFNKNFTIWDDPEDIYEHVFKRYFSHMSREVKEYIRKCRTLESAHTVSLDGRWIDGLVVSDKPVVRDNTASQLAGLLLLSAGNIETIEKCIRRRELATSRHAE